MNILVTGGAGFIGSHVVDAYVAAGHSVWVMDNLSRGNRQNVNSKATLLRMDLNSPALRSLFAEHQFDCVNHHAAQIDVRVSVADPVLDAHINIGGTLNLLEAMRDHRVARIIFASTGGAIYGNHQSYPADEAHPTIPISPYGVAKLSVEHYLECYHQVHGLRYTVLRYANVFGPRQDPKGEAGVVAIFCSRILQGHPLTIFGDGTQTRDYVYVEDVADANVKALNYLTASSRASRPVELESTRHAKCTSCNEAILPNEPLVPQRSLGPAARPIFNIGTGIETSVNALASLLLEAANLYTPLRHQPPRSGELHRSALDPRRAAQELAWKPQTSLEQGLFRTLEWFRKRREGCTPAE
jgi:UDP-glucose 4-epimerase